LQATLLENRITTASNGGAGANNAVAGGDAHQDVTL